MDNTTRVKVGLTIWQRPGYGLRKRLRPGQISDQTRDFTNAKANFKQTRGFPSARANFMPNKGFSQC